MGPTYAIFAPGRVNLIGEHTDYSGGLVLPAAIALGVTISGSVAPDRIALRSLALEESVELAPDGSGTGDLPGWGRCIAAVARFLDEQGRAPVGIEGTIASTVPIGAGLSSSAALTVAVGLALCRAAGFELSPLALARLARDAENDALGVPCGLMDPAASLLSVRGHALLLDCTTEQWSLVRLPEEAAIVVFDSGVRHSNASSGYATRRAELERALVALEGRLPSELTLDEAMAASRGRGLDELATRRLRHVVSENERVRDLVRALESPGGADGRRIGELMRASHQSLRDDYEVSTPELDLLVDLAYENGAIGARLTGGGFGGSVLALSESSRAEAFAASVSQAYEARARRKGTALVCPTVDGAAAASRAGLVSG
ncbi:MAG TPA: galactokinase [Gaiellaceae bacterium]|jgi:galactokinase|nr:galactokinase [Gaiellaceae bacterium]